MGKKVNRDREKVLSKTDIKANNILKAVEAYETKNNKFLIWRVIVFFRYSPSSVAYHIKEKHKIRYLLNSTIERQKLTPIKKAVLKDYIYNYL